MTNFGTDPVPLPQGTVMLASAPIHGGQLPPDTTAWLLLPGAWHSPNGSGRTRAHIDGDTVLRQ